MKKKYIALEIEITEFDGEDVITTSDIQDGDEDFGEGKENDV